MDVVSALQNLGESSAVEIQSSTYLASHVRKKSARVDAERTEKKLPLQARKPRLTPVPKSEHGGVMSITPWELLHTLGRATVLAGNGSSRALAQHWGCLKYITTLQANDKGRMELSDDGKDPSFHRKSVQAEDLGIAFALAAALRVAYVRHPDHHFEVVDADVALEAGWTVRGADIQQRPNMRLRPDYFLVGVKDGEPVRVITVECKGSHGEIDAQHIQLAKAAAQVNAVVIGNGAPPPSLLMATSLAGRGGIEMRILDPTGDGVLALPEDQVPSLNGPVQEFNDFPAIPTTAPDGRKDSRPGFYIPQERSEWFSRVLIRTAAASLLAFVGDRASARYLLTERQRRRVGPAVEHPSTGIVCDTAITLAGMDFVGTDHVFRLDGLRVEAFSGMLRGLHRTLAEQHDVQQYERVLPAARDAWSERRSDAQLEWGGPLAMDADGAVLGLRIMGAGKELS
ncbi:hypothetical protein ABH935_006361 [Catenulispora sp. GAS73]|uniref:hypothetical protein n=1 Tax=Catenulispora sp. GAS73 TaxID=3156269 RepID=UPI003513A23D